MTSEARLPAAYLTPGTSSFADFLGAQAPELLPTGRGTHGDPGDLAIVQGVIGLARSFGYRVIAEGVETVEQGQMLLQLGCLQAQGYCIARPMPLEDFIGWTPHWQPPAGWQRNRPI